MRILQDFVAFAGTLGMFVSSPTTSSPILKLIRQRLIEGTINTINKVCATARPINQIHLPRGLKFAIGSTDFVDMRENAMNNTSTHVMKQI